MGLLYLTKVTYRNIKNRKNCQKNVNRGGINRNKDEDRGRETGECVNEN
jgi:hypothetical protein